MVGPTLAHYKILEKIGSGGMGDVYLAEDTKLDRKIALKVLPPDLAESEMRRARFKREAKAIAALNHPNIVHVYSVEEADGIHFITMELVKGKTLTELLPQKGFALDKFFEIAIPLADAVAAAHQEGITHRDLKPDNMMVGEDGRVKVLDFGLAKPNAGLVGAHADSELPTAIKTEEGVILGTLSYMSPEQAQGKAVDARSDIFSLGIVFYEMLTGRRPFGGENPASVLSSIIKEDPPSVSELDPELPRDLVKIVHRCLTKEPTRRFQSALDLRNEFEELKQDVASGEASAPVVRKTSRGPIVALSLVATLAIAAVLFLLVPEGEPIPRLTNPVQITSAIGVEDYPTWSPDGRTLAFTSNQSGFGRNWDIWVVQVDGGQPVNRTEDHPGVDRFPSWSPDGSWIAFWSDRDSGGYYVMSALGGTPRKVPNKHSSFEMGPPQWSADGDELACLVVGGSEHFIEIVSLGDGNSRRVDIPGRTRSRYEMSWSPEGRFFAYVSATTLLNDVTQLWVFNVEDASGFPVTDGWSKVWSPSWSSGGRTLNYVSNRGGSADLWQQAMGPDGHEGAPDPITIGVGIRHAVFSPDGSKLAYSKGRIQANLWRVPILKERPATWSDAQQLTFDNAYLEAVDVSPDGKRLVVSTDRGGNMDLWIMGADGGEMQPLTTDPSPDWLPAWSPDGLEIVFYSYRSGNRDVWVMSADGGPAKQLTKNGSESYYPAWSADGQEIAFHSRRSGNDDIWIVPAEGGEARQVTKHTAGDRMARYSPDGKWLAFDSRRSGERRLWRVPTAGATAEPVTKGPGEFPRWSADSKAIFFVGRGDRAGNLWSVWPDDGVELPMTNLEGRPGELGRWGLATDGDYVYFTWRENLGDLWVMDVVQ